MRPLSTLRAATVNTPDVLRAMRNLWLDRLVHLAQRRPARSRFVRGKSFNQFQRRRKQPSRPTKPGILNRSKPLVLKGRKRPSQTPPHSTTKETRRPPRAMPNASMRLLTWAASEYVLMILDRAMPNASTRLLTAANYHAEARHPTKATHDNQQKFTIDSLKRDTRCFRPKIKSGLLRRSAGPFGRRDFWKRPRFQNIFSKATKPRPPTFILRRESARFWSGVETTRRPRVNVQA